MNSKIRKLEEKRPCPSPSPTILMGKHHSQESHRSQELQAGPWSLVGRLGRWLCSLLYAHSRHRAAMGKGHVSELGVATHTCDMARPCLLLPRTRWLM